MADAIAIWAEADLEIDVLDDLGQRIRRQVDDGATDPQQMQALMHALGIGLAVLELARAEPAARRELTTTTALAVSRLVAGAKAMKGQGGTRP